MWASRDLPAQVAVRPTLRELITGPGSEKKLVFFRLDPFPKDLTITVSKESGDSAVATIEFAAPTLKGSGPQPAGDWKLDENIGQIFVKPLPWKGYATVVDLKKEEGKWKFDFKADSSLQHRVGRMNEKYKNYVNPFQMVTQEVKNDPSTRENTTTRLKQLLEGAGKE